LLLRAGDYGLAGCSEVVCTTVAFARTRVHDGDGDCRMVEGPVVECGVLTASAQTWDAAVRRAEVIRQLAEQATVGLDAADSAAAELGISRRQGEGNPDPVGRGE
jgi:hypothetical protein